MGTSSSFLDNQDVRSHAMQCLSPYWSTNCGYVLSTETQDTWFLPLLIPQYYNCIVPICPRTAFTTSFPASPCISKASSDCPSLRLGETYCRVNLFGFPENHSTNIHCAPSETWLQGSTSCLLGVLDPPWPHCLT